MSQKKKSALERWIDNHRELLLITTIIPIGFWVSLFSRLVERLSKPHPKMHKERVERICREVSHYAETPERGHLRTNRKSPLSLNVRVSDKSGDTQIRMDDMRSILFLDRDKGIVRVEPFVKIGDLARWLDRRGFQLAASIEMKNATIGGLVLAVGMTTNSHREGLMHEIVQAYEIVTAKGKLVRAEETGEHGDLFRALPWSHGTLGLLTAVELQVVQAPKFVRLEYRPFFNMEEFTREYQSLLTAENPPDYLEGQMFGRDKAVLIEGYKAFGPRERSLKVNNVASWYNPFFFKHAESMLRLEAGKRHRELVPNFSFLMRHDRSMCMTMGSIAPHTNHPLFRYLMGWMMPPNMPLLKQSRPPEERIRSMNQQVYQDLGFPAERLPELLDYLDREFEIYPLLVYPCKIIDRGGMVRHPDNRNKPWDREKKSAFFCNLGIYGEPRAVRGGDLSYPVVDRVRHVESLVRDWGGFLHTYVDIFSTRSEFEQMFDHSLWREMREKYHANEAFPEIYDKIKPEIDPLQFSKEESRLLV